MAHRLFPGFAALWFAALFGLGSLAASGEVLGALVMRLHLPAILPAAAPPLGMTARIVLALGLAGLGGVIGLLTGLVLHFRAGGVLPQRPIRAAADPVAPVVEPEPDHDQAPRVRSRDAHPDAPPRRPLVVTEDVLPYPTNMVEPVSAVAPAAEFSVPDSVHGDPEHGFDAANEPSDLPPFLAAAMSAVQHEQRQAPIFVAPVEPADVPAEIVEIAASEHEQDAGAPIADEPALAKVPVVPASAPPLASVAAAAPKVALDQVPLASLGLVQLIERLALAIAARQANRSVAAVQGADAVDPRMPLHRFDPLTMDPAGPLLRAKKVRDNAPDTGPDAWRDGGADQVAAPAQLHDPLAQSDDWDEDQTAHALPARFLGQPQTPDDRPAVDEGADEPCDVDGADADHRYSSLADMALSRPELLTVAAPAEHAHDEAADPGFDPPAFDQVVRFPARQSGGETAGHAPPSDDADRALREALATLRQMSAQR